MTCASCCSCGWPPASTLDEDLEKRIRAKIRTGASPRHVPAKIVAVTDIPRTKSGKITELAVRDVVHGRAIKNKEALANPEALELFREPAATCGLSSSRGMVNEICRSNLPRFHEWYTFVNFRRAGKELLRPGVDSRT